MALIDCTECGGKISDHAKACPHCGCPVPAATKPAESQATPPPIEPSTQEAAPDQWYYQDGSQIHGPLSSHQLADLATHGALRPDHQVRKGTNGHWHRASEVKGLHFAAAPPGSGVHVARIVSPPLPAHGGPPAQRGPQPATNAQPRTDPAPAVILLDNGPAVTATRASLSGQPSYAPPIASPAPTTATAPRRPWLLYAAICLGCTFVLCVLSRTLCACGLLAALVLGGYGLADKFIISAARPAVSHPKLRWLAIGLFVATPFVWIIVGADPSQGNTEWIEAISRAAKDSVIKLRTDQAEGTGFVVAAHGNRRLILTNRHVLTVEQGFVFKTQTIAPRCHVVLSGGEEVTGSLAGFPSDSDVDLALVVVDCPKLRALKVHRFEDVVVGEPVAAVGHPLDLDYTVTNGIVSQKRDPYVQHNAAINHGNSGGPLYDQHGEVIAVNTLFLGDSQGLFFSIRADLLLHPQLWTIDPAVKELLERVNR